jgi:hypothetical protein
VQRERKQIAEGAVSDAPKDRTGQDRPGQALHAICAAAALCHGAAPSTITTTCRLPNPPPRHCAAETPQHRALQPQPCLLLLPSCCNSRFQLTVCMVWVLDSGNSAFTQPRLQPQPHPPLLVVDR